MRKENLKGAYFFIVFFLLFALAILFIPAPMFPGDTLLRMTNLTTLEHAFILSALINALVYGLIAWAIFAFVMRRIENPSRREHVKRQKRRR
jgi:hypothetical protein